MSLHLGFKMVGWIGILMAGWNVQDIQPDDAVREWIRSSAVHVVWNDDASCVVDLGPIDERFQQMRVVGLGEATHGQHEVFEWKRRLTMHMIQKHGFRLVAYEASSSSLVDAASYIDGSSDDRSKAIRALGMLIWQVEENGALLDDLRRWNLSGRPEDRVELIGIDAQDPRAIVKRIAKLLKADTGPWLVEADRLIKRSQELVELTMSGKPAPWSDLTAEVDRWIEELQALEISDPKWKQEIDLRSLEFRESITLFRSSGQRDKVMAQLLQKQLDRRGDQCRCVVWAHNGHVQRSELRYLGSQELAMGGHLASMYGDRYYALGVAFGEGEFQANAIGKQGKWGFRRYRLASPPEGSFESMLKIDSLDWYLLDLRQESVSSDVQKWLDSGHGQRWYGGYNVPEDCYERTRDVTQLLPTFPKRDFDGLLFVSNTTAAHPIDSERIIFDP